MILKDDCTERPLLAIEVRSAEVETCNMRLFHPPLGLSIFYGSRDQLRPGSLLHKRKEPGNEVGKGHGLNHEYLIGMYIWLFCGITTVV
jgi:hypothetical protein